MICDFCSMEFGEIFDSTLRIDYSEPGKGKLHEYHICLNCRKIVLDWIESKKNKDKKMEVKNYA